jgi:hypothetical protein
MSDAVRDQAIAPSAAPPATIQGSVLLTDNHVRPAIAASTRKADLFIGCNPERRGVTPQGETNKAMAATRCVLVEPRFDRDAGMPLHHSAQPVCEVQCLTSELSAARPWLVRSMLRLRSERWRSPV